jgi:DUF1365 family protein
MGGRVEEDGALYAGDVVHKRARPKRHSLRYSTVSLLVDLDRLDELDGRLSLFSVNRFNLFSLRLGDFGPRDGTPLRDFLASKAKAAGVGERVTRVRMLCYPRIVGLGFNPLTVYYLDDEAGRTLMLVYEVHNTFGERHFYDAVVETAGGVIADHSLAKAFYVSPFNTVGGTYRFSVRPPGDAVFTGITLSDESGGLVTAYHCADRQALSDASLLRLAAAQPWAGVKVVAAIYWEALRLWLKGIPHTLDTRQAIRPPRTRRVRPAHTAR